MKCGIAIRIVHFNTIIIQSRNLSISIGPILYANRKSILGYIRKHDETSIDASTISSHQSNWHEHSSVIKQRNYEIPGGPSHSPPRSAPLIRLERIKLNLRADLERESWRNKRSDDVRKSKHESSAHGARGHKSPHSCLSKALLDPPNSYVISLTFVPVKTQDTRFYSKARLLTIRDN